MTTLPLSALLPLLLLPRLLLLLLLRRLWALLLLLLLLLLLSVLLAPLYLIFRLPLRIYKIIAIRTSTLAPAA